MNISGHRLSTTEVEHGVGRAPVGGRGRGGRGLRRDDRQAIVAFVTLKMSAETPRGPGLVIEELRNHVAKVIDRSQTTSDHPDARVAKTRSGKIMRRLLRDVAENRRL